MAISAPEIDDMDMAVRARESLRVGYVPPDELVIDPSLKLHQDADVELDPITYEVIRSKLWNLNLDHCETIKRTSGSQFVAEANDLNITLTTETGEAIAFGPYAVLFAGYADMSIKWTLEFRSSNPGIGDGDVFVHDDPWIATNHANDICVYAPVFWDDELFAWLYSTAHHRDVGGPISGSINPNALTAFDEPTLFPAVRLVEGGRLRQDIMDVWTRRSRLPEIAALELKSQLAGISFARERLLEVIERYGAGVVKRAMYKRIEDAAKVIGERLARLPDGSWRDEAYVAGATSEDVRPYKVCLTFDKRGDRLRVSNAGTDPSVGVLNQTVGGFRGAIVAPLFDALAWDLELCGAGLLRQLDFDVEPGKINSATHPAAVGSSIGMTTVQTQARTLAAKMVSGEPELSAHAAGVGALHTLSCLGIGGTADQYRKRFAGVFLDMIGGGSGAVSTRDGIDHGGRSYLSMIPDVEEVERAVPVLCLYRHSFPKSGAHGRFRGGAAGGSAFLAHKGEEAGVHMIGLLPSVTLGKSVDGGWPSTGGRQRYAEESKVRELFADGRIPTSADELDQLAELANTEKRRRPFVESAVYEMVSQPGGAFGDPLLRAPAAVVADLSRGAVAPEDVLDVYGVVSSNSGYDEEATRQKREQLVQERLGKSRPPREPCEGAFEVDSDAVWVLAGVALSQSGTHLGCAHCGQCLSPATGNFRLGCRELERTLPSISPLFEDPEAESGELLVFRQYLCSSCGIAVDGDVCKPADYPYVAFELPGNG
jgi:N-methylhydantoinase B